MQLKTFTNILAVIVITLSFGLLYMGAAFEKEFTKSIFFITVALIFDFSVLLSSILFIIVCKNENYNAGVWAFTVNLLILVLGSTILMVLHKSPKAVLYLYDTAVIMFYGLFFYFRKNK
jgi:NADH:ubiquinone oxidoreductase subunit 2 (subunit N)